MPGAGDPLRTEFAFGSTSVAILVGNILDPGVDVEAVVSTDDNYLTMAGGVSEQLRVHSSAELGEGDPEYVREAQIDCPVEAGTVVVTRPYGLRDYLPNVKYVFHGAVIDYDSERNPDERRALVAQTTANCLHEAEKRAVQSILFPAFASGAGRLGKECCATAMCEAIKTYLAVERPVKWIYILLFGDDPEQENSDYIKQANLVLGVPYSPESEVRQIRDFYGREQEMQRLTSIVTGEYRRDGQKCHALILGGPSTGKEALLDQLHYLSRQEDSALNEGRRLVRLTFGGVHRNTPASFIYRKFLHAMAEDAKGSALEGTIREAYADSGMANCTAFLAFLDRDGVRDRYPEIVFLVNKLPRLLQYEDETDQDRRGVQEFWKDLPELQARVRFVYTARYEEYDELRDTRLEDLAPAFLERVEPLPLHCIAETEQKGWIDQLFARYLHRAGGAPDWARDFLELEAGRHPYLISLLGFTLVERLKRYLLDRPAGEDVANLDRLTRQKVCEDVLESTAPRRRALFGWLIAYLRGTPYWEQFRYELETLAKATAVEEQQKSLIPAGLRGDPNVVSELQALGRQGDLRQALHAEWLKRLEDRGLIVDATTPGGAQFMAKSFAAYTFEALVGRMSPSDQPKEVTITVLAPGRNMIRTVFQGRGAKVLTADKRFLQKDKDRFMQSFQGYIRKRFHQPGSEESVFAEAEEISNYILTQFATVAVKRYLRNAPRPSSVTFLIDEVHADLPWELMLEATYAGEIPFRVGRTIVSKRAAQYVLPPVRGIRRIKPLLIGDPGGDLEAAGSEVEELACIFRSHQQFFDEPDVLVGPDKCRSIQLLNALSSGRYHLVHYAGHARFEGSQSAWQAADGELRTDQLTNAIEMAPPAFVFGSACASAEGGALGPTRYEGQSFDLPGAFLQAGVEAYIGALWPVDATRARLFARAFYERLASGKYELGECLRLAKWARKQEEEREGLLDWLAFILYGDPQIGPGDLFPIMRTADGSS
jgi:O-acetyl-ADP-ribose deacetylase (regulator of RNase III)